MFGKVGRRIKTRSILILGLTLVLGVSVVATPVSAQSEAGPEKSSTKAKDVKYVEWFSARAFTMTTTKSVTATVEIGMTGWTPEASKRGLIVILAEQGREKFVEALANQPDLGFVRVDRSRATIRYAEEWENEGRRQILLATDRPLVPSEVINRDRTARYNLSLIMLDLDDNNKGTGELAPGVEIEFDPATKRFTAEIYAAQPVRLSSVRPRPKKVHQPE